MRSAMLKTIDWCSSIRLRKYSGSSTTERGIKWPLEGSGFCPSLRDTPGRTGENAESWVRGQSRARVHSEAFAVVHAAVYDRESRCLVDALGKLVGDPCIGSHFQASLGTRPVFAGGQELSANALAAPVRVDIPAFDETDSMRGIASVGVGAQVDLQEAHKLA